MNGLSAEALAKLEGLDLQEVRSGLNFTPAMEVRQPIGADLSSEELAGLRSWDLSGVMARLNSLTFEPPPAPMPEPDAGDAEIPDWLQPRDSGRAVEAPGAVTHAADEGEFPDWLRPAEETAPPAGAGPPAEETAEPAPLPEEQPAAPGQRPPVEAPSPSPREQWDQSPDDQRNVDLGEWYRKLQAGESIEDWQRQALRDFNIWAGGSLPTAEEAVAGLAAAEAAGAGTQVFHEGEMVIPPARKRESHKQLSDWLSKVDWKRVALEGVEILGPAIFSAGLYEAFPQLRNGMVAVASTAFGLGALTEAAAGGILMAEKRFPRLARLAKLAGYVRGKGYLTMQLSASALAGMAVTGIVHHFQLQAATEAVGAGDGGTGWEGITDRGADMGRGDSGDLRQKPEAVVGGEGGRSASLLSPSQQEFVNRAGEVAEQEARQMADAAQGAAEHQRVVEAALTPQQLTGAELTGGTVWGHEEAFVNTLSKIAHPNVATNALKNLAYGLEQGQPFTQIGPTDVVNLVNPDVGAKIAAAASDIVGREPSTLTGVDKMLWELGVLGEHATRAVAEAVIKAFANK